MSFSTLEFIIIFLPIFLIIYFLLLKVQKKSSTIANIWIVLGSLLFCMYADYVGHTYYNMLVVSIITVFNFCVAHGVSYFYKKQSYSFLRVATFAFGVIVDIGVLVLYKLVIKALPIGISYYIFALVAYLTDVYRNKVCAEKNFINFSAYVLMFPKLVQGPITRYSGFSEKLKKRQVSVGRFDRALKLFILGLSYKVLVADVLESLFREIQKIGFESISTPLAWLGAVSYSLQLYFDFLGYSMIAVALGGMLGFHLPKNFDNPYASRSVSEFYRRWHVTLGLWFRDYIYIPLGGSRKGIVRTIINLLIVWLITGFWHGTTLNFILWGGILFFFIAIEKLFLGKLLYKTQVVSRVYTLFVIVISWVVFAIHDIKKLWVYITRLFPFIPTSYNSNVLEGDYIKYGKMYGVVVLLAILLCIPRVNKWIVASRRKWVSSFVGIVLFVICVYRVSKGLSNPFMYYDF